MFERYTEKARRVIFFARYEASQFGSPLIETEHLLLGLLREDTALAGRLSRSPLSPEALRKRIEEETPPREKVSTSVDMPLSPACKATLKYAVEEADRFQHRHIGTEHLLLGLLRVERSLAAKLLAEAGFNILELREELRRAERHPGRPAERREGRLEDYVEIHGELWSVKSIREFSEYYRKFHWEKRRWTPRDALVQRSDKTLYLYSGQAYDSEQVELMKGGWSEDHCAICWWKLFQSDSIDHAEGYTNGQDWLCTECCERFVNPQTPWLPPSPGR
jgi:hypothetical protein